MSSSIIPLPDLEDKPKHTTYALAGRYARALIHWVWMGRPMRTQKEIEHIYDAYCSPCSELVVKDKGSECAICGCRLDRTKVSVKNKIALATTSCPADPPKWVTGMTYDTRIDGQEEALYEEYQQIVDKETKDEQ